MRKGGMVMIGKVLRGVLWTLLGVAYALLVVYGFLSGMFSESLIGSTHPWADAMADAIMWFGVVVGVAPAVCAAAASALAEKPVARRSVLALPFILMAIQLLLGYIADML